MNLVKPTKVVIKRSLWVRGNKMGLGASRLLQNKASLCHPSDTPRMCCLGFYCKAAGVPESDMLGEPVPECLPYDVPGLGSASVVSNFVYTNDNGNISEKERERLLKLTATSIGVEFVFED